MEISKNKVVSISYDLRVESFDSEIIESVDEKNPMIFIFDNGDMLESFEAKLLGLKKGNEFKFSIESKDAYGDVIDDYIMDLPKNLFEVDGKIDDEMLFVGNVVPMKDEEGNQYDALIIEINDSSVQVDFNHPLAGEDLFFTGKIIDVREATKSELEHGHVHDGGHHH